MVALIPTEIIILGALAFHALINMSSRIHSYIRSSDFLNVIDNLSLIPLWNFFGTGILTDTAKLQLIIWFLIVLGWVGGKIVKNELPKDATLNQKKMYPIYIVNLVLCSISTLYRLCMTVTF